MPCLRALRRKSLRDLPRYGAGRRAQERRVKRDLLLYWHVSRCQSLPSFLKGVNNVPRERPAAKHAGGAVIQPSCRECRSKETSPTESAPSQRRRFTFVGAMLSTMMAGLAALSPTLEGLRATPVVRASDAATVALPNLWRANTPFRVNIEAAASLKPAVLCLSAPYLTCTHNLTPTHVRTADRR